MMDLIAQVVIWLLTACGAWLFATKVANAKNDKKRADANTKAANDAKEIRHEMRDASDNDLHNTLTGKLHKW